MKNTLPDDVMFVYNTFLEIATERKCAFAGLLMRAEPATIAVIGNVNETGHALAELLRQYADIVDRSTDEERIERPEPQ